MACAKPVIATRWSGNLEFMDDSNSLLVDVEGMEAVDHRHEVPYHQGQRWALPSLEHLVERLRTVVLDPEGSAARGRKARQDVVERWGWEGACRVAAERLSDLGVGRAPLSPRRPAPCVVVWSGAGDQVFSLAKIDREITSRLARDCRLAVVKRDEAPPGMRADVWIGHAWPPELSPPANGRWVVILHWDYGALPAAWVEALKDRVDEIWVPSQHVRDACLQSGLPPERVVVTANGVDPQRFRPDVEPLPLATRKRFRFLYVGTAAWRKGLDILVNSYLREFRAGDDVCLVAKVQAPGDAPEERAAWESIRRCQAVPGGPEIELIDRTLTEDEMPRLYAACDCLVHPYRAEGFCIPLAEAMACGLPVVVTGYGPALEVCDPHVTSFIPARVVSRGEHRIGEWETIGDPHRAEPDPHALRRLMRLAVDDATEARSRARRAAGKNRARLDWDRTAHVVADRILRLSGQPIRRFSPNETQPARPAIVPSRERIHHTLRWGDAVLRLETPDAELARVVADLAGIDGEPMTEAPGPHVAVWEANAGFVVSAASRSIWCATRDDVILALVGALSDGFAAAADRHVLVHAGAVVADGRAALFVGPERAGKSWLAFAAWLDGFTVIGDDMIALHPGGRTASAFPRPFKLRVTEPRLPRELAGRGIKDGVALGRVDGEWRVAIGRRNPGIAHHATPYPVSHLFFLSRRDTGPSATAAVADPREAVAQLTAATAIGGTPLDMRVVALLRALWDGGGVERLEVGPDDAPGALALLRERLARAR
jgi:glycosyltransferase involved in cell wall biosynthesis